jgi:hypothetical protein
MLTTANPRTILDQLTSCHNLKGAGVVDSKTSRHTIVAIEKATVSEKNGLTGRGIVFWATWYTNVPTTVSSTGK